MCSKMLAADARMQALLRNPFALSVRRFLPGTWGLNIEEEPLQSPLPPLFTSVLLQAGLGLFKNSNACVKKIEDEWDPMAPAYHGGALSVRAYVRPCFQEPHFLDRH